MIRSFRCPDTEHLFVHGTTKKWASIKDVAVRKLTMLDAATDIRDLNSPPGNNLEALKGNRQGQHSIRINEKYRICFVWSTTGPEHVEIVDYH
ncbi:type II toxin-antitoxin system RelE/ParE family toxin [Pseudomonas sp. BN515]|uniref:type II toxin-antitoxin system RelE/ParE family toxin n=1 Tax=Pseudomonas sp. BN515 TaxID=2567892 RepID=UPI002457BB28|nr:type II toxin-antitoxin system RelE/ParE family toxin [Pseudomonas sp. BN515]MDH4872749.1 plasmid maintenance system killer protein [Pseudomonas sp. BN515]